MGGIERIFTLKLKEEVVNGGDQMALHEPMCGELWQGEGRVPVSGVTTYRGRVDAVITFFVDQFLSDDIFQPGDSLELATEKGESIVLLTRRGHLAGDAAQH
ncbi:hypothetical protein EBR21_10450 [bacterium]|nr:hypothetical protein [bacterium]